MGFLVLDVAVPGVGSGGLDAEGDQAGGVPRGVKRRSAHLQESRFVQYQMVGRGHDHRCLRVALGDDSVGVGDAGGRVAHERLAEDVLHGHVGKVRRDLVAVPGVGDDQDAVGGNELFKPVKRHANERPPRSQNVEELLGFSASRHGPKTRPNASRHDHGVGVCFVGHVLSVGDGQGLTTRDKWGTFPCWLWSWCIRSTRGCPAMRPRPEELQFLSGSWPRS